MTNPTDTAENLTWFQNLTTPEVADIVRQRGTKTAVFAAGGTTRWFILNHLEGWPTDMSYWPGYLRQGGQRFLEIARLFFDHGIHTLFTHAIVPGQLEGGKGKGYLPLALTSGMERLAGSPEFLQFYQDYGVRVRFFGDYRRILRNSEYAGALDRFDYVAQQTKTNRQHRIYWGFNTNQDRITPSLELAVQYYREHGRQPTRDHIIAMIYGEPVPPVDIFVGFNRPKTTNLMPPLLDEKADLYFTVGLSFDFTQVQLRAILYDHLYARKGRHRDYTELPASAFSEMQTFYRLNREKVTGLGQRYEAGAIWHPAPQTQLPPDWDKENA